MSKYKSHKISFKLVINKRIVMLSLGFLFIVIMITCGMLFTCQSWNNYKTSYSRRFTNAKTVIDKAILQNQSNSVNKLDNIVQIKSKLIMEIQSYCEVPSLIQWQSYIGQYSNEIDDCTQRKQHLSQLLFVLDEAVGYLKLEQKLTAIISKSNIDTNQNIQINKLDLIEQVWRQAAVDISKLPETYQFKTTKTLASDKVVKIAEAWRQLCNANDTKNRQQFEDSHSNLNQIYASLSEVSDYSKSEIEKLVYDLGTNYEKVY